VSGGSATRWSFTPEALADERMSGVDGRPPPIKYAAPGWIFWDVGLTLVYPSPGLICDALRDMYPGHRCGKEEVLATLVVAAEGRHLRWPSAHDGDARVARTWAMLLDLPPDAAAVLAVLLARTDLYRALDPSAGSVLRRLRATGISLGAISNSDGTLREELAHFGLDEHFSVVVDSHDVGSEKPQSRIFETALARAGVEAGDAWHVGDGLLNDYLASRALGLRPVLLDRYERYGGSGGICAVRDLAEVSEAAAPRASGTAAGPR
jgi:FMN phosphatase YigB (HAD superfamily)